MAAERAVGGRPSLPRLAALLVLAFVGIVGAGVLLKQRFPDLQNALGQGMGATGLTFVAPVALAAALGLWLRKPWGWWFSLIVVAWQALSYSLFLTVVLASGDATGPLTWATAVILVAMLVVILLPDTRRACIGS
jgi:ABC-type uncharacterized transport system permease subunit